MSFIMQGSPNIESDAPKTWKPFDDNLERNSETLNRLTCMQASTNVEGDVSGIWKPFNENVEHTKKR